MNFKYFTENEIVNPIFNNCPAKNWQELPTKIAKNLTNNIEAITPFRDWLDTPLLITSSWRPASKGSPHQNGFAIDYQIKDNSTNINLHKECIKWFQKFYSLKNSRLFLEYKGNGMWLHFDINFKKNNEIEIFIGYPKNNNMIYEKYNGLTPIEKV